MEKGNINEVTVDHQKLVVSGLMHNSYCLAQVSDDLKDSFFTDSACRIIYKSVLEYYREYGSVPGEMELMASIDDNFIELGPTIDSVKTLAGVLSDSEEIDEDYLMDKLKEMIRKSRTNRVLHKSLDQLSSQGFINNEQILRDMIEALTVEYSRNGLFNLTDLDELSEKRREAIGDEEQSTIIKSVIPSVNTSLQYKGYQRGTMNLIVAPPGCFTGDTPILMKDGSEIPIEKLFEMEHVPPVYSFYVGRGIRVEGRAESAYLSHMTRDLVEVTVNLTHKIRCTPDHPFLVGRSSMVQAGNLKAGDFLVGMRYNGNSSIPKFLVTSVKQVKTPEPVPVYGLVNVAPHHNYAISLGGGLGVFVGNTGKTSFLVNEGAYAAQQGFNVLHVFLGDMVGYDGFVRYVSNISGINQSDIVEMSQEEQEELVLKLNSEYNGILSRINILSYGSSEITVDALLENIRKEQDKSGRHFDDIIIDYADNFSKPNENMYVEGGYIYESLAGFARTNASVIMVASQPKVGYWKEELIPLEGAAESSKKQHIVDLLMTFNLIARTSNLGNLYIPKVRRGTSCQVIRVETHWENCRLSEITEGEFLAKRSEQNL